MKFRILYCDRDKDADLASYASDLARRINKLAKIEEVWVNTAKFSALEPKARRAAETEQLEEQIGQNEYVVALQEKGKTFASSSFAQWIQGLAVKGHSRVCFVIGGAYGLDDSINQRANAILSLSPLTFTSQLARAVLVEQLYRALSIIHGAPYHKE